LSNGNRIRLACGARSKYPQCARQGADRNRAASTLIVANFVQHRPVDGYPGPTDRPSLTLAESIHRRTHRLDPKNDAASPARTRSRPSCCSGRGSGGARSALLSTQPVGAAKKIQRGGVPRSLRLGTARPAGLLARGNFVPRVNRTPFGAARHPALDVTQNSARVAA